MEIQENNSIYCGIKKNKMLKNRFLTKEAKDLYIENYKTLLK